jgi:hypothetical protein
MRSPSDSAAPESEYEDVIDPNDPGRPIVRRKRDDAACDHDWQWLERPVFTFGMIGQRQGGHNVECTRCGARAWAHGRGPTRPARTAIERPTTGRS